MWVCKLIGWKLKRFGLRQDMSSSSRGTQKLRSINCRIKSMCKFNCEWIFEEESKMTIKKCEASTILPIHLCWDWLENHKISNLFQFRNFYSVIFLAPPSSLSLFKLFRVCLLNWGFQKKMLSYLYSLYYLVKLFFFQMHHLLKIVYLAISFNIMYVFLIYN